VYVNLFDGKIFHETPDANPDGPSSMHLCGIKVGEFSIALIQGIDRGEKSQVTKFVEKHGDHSFQHIAIAVDDINAALKDLREKGARFLTDEIHERVDSFGPIRQIFSRKFDINIDSDEAPFFEFVERPRADGLFHSGESFSDDFARELYRDIEESAHKDDQEVFVNNMSK